ncbi:DNA polymerase iota-like isoform X1 [Anthonomus grandis grandis]|uniref:DNA polymerase iota-like isoform X1 n=1 Tax=Anthonomus grandis grandis TaxID=2921223 RepID=UPI00216553F6|nr:DNA polymerase iota-like isoform X1 [Anthonomus grandis grandis]XP_050305478.1 DNA polymerase iota-like isoform X1 [Anthonomus grandis grandis]
MPIFIFNLSRSKLKKTNEPPVKTNMEDHSRTIVHIDIDCFYAQVEEVKNPSLKLQPVGIQQKNCLVTSNYKAREYGLKKCMSVTEAKKLCPKLVLINGEDLQHYRQYSSKVSDLLRGFSDLVERLGLDENFIDVTALVNERMASNYTPVGCIYGDVSGTCDCGCYERLCIGSQIAQEMRDAIFEQLSLTTCAGIAHNKLLAKLVGSKNKPNKQTILFPDSALELMLGLQKVCDIPSIGVATGKVLNDIHIFTVKDLQSCQIRELEMAFDPLKAKHLKQLSYGVDESLVKPYAKPLTISLEDAKCLVTKQEVQDKLSELLGRLLILVKSDGRTPKVIKVSVRKYNPTTGGQRETRQCPLSVSLDNQTKLVEVAYGLFKKIITEQSFKVTLLGVGFSKFIDVPNQKNTLDGFFKQSSDVIEPPIKRIKLAKEERCLKCPPGVDIEVFGELPLEVQQELWDEHKSKERKVVSKGKVNTMLNYFSKEPRK